MSDDILKRQAINRMVAVAEHIRDFAMSVRFRRDCPAYGRAALRRCSEGLRDRGPARILVLFLLGFSTLIFRVAPLSAQTIYANVYIFNETNTTFDISGSPDGGWSTANKEWASVGKQWSCPAGSSQCNPDGSPPSILGPGQGITFNSASTGGLLPSGTGGTINIVSHGSSVNDVGSVHLSVPWCAAHGCATCSSSISPSGLGFPAASLSGGYNAQGSGGD